MRINREDAALHLFTVKILIEGLPCAGTVMGNLEITMHGQF